MQVYVDDPVVVLQGPTQRRRLHVALLMLSWYILGISLAIKKGQFGTDIDWIGFTYSICPSGVRVSALASRMTEVQQMAADINKSNVVSLKNLRTFVGKVQSLASLLFMWRPFVHMFYAVIHGDPGGAPLNCRWVSQIRIPLDWLIAFFRGSPGTLERHFALDAYLRLGDQIRITTDACPHGLGAVLECNHQVVSFFSHQV